MCVSFRPEPGRSVIAIRVHPAAANAMAVAAPIPGDVRKDMKLRVHGLASCCASDDGGARECVERRGHGGLFLFQQ